MYATVYDVEKRCKRKLSIDEIEWCESLLQDAAIIVDTYGKNASKEAKQLVSCNAEDVKMRRSKTGHVLS